MSIEYLLLFLANQPQEQQFLVFEVLGGAESLW
jgi:hypothetical protein